MRERLAVFQFTREEQPAFSGSNEALAMVVVALRMRELLFGHRSAVGRGEHYTTPVTPRGRLIANILEVRLLKIAHTFEVGPPLDRTRRFLSIRKANVS
jgi:hypothetical protein